MIVTQKFVFIHLHKTGGQFLARGILNYMQGAQQVGYHYPRKMLPAEHCSLPVVGFVRNPWDWYVSWYSFNTYRPNGNPLYAVMSDGGQLDFNHTINNMLEFGSDNPKSLKRREELRRQLPDSIAGNRGIGLTKSCLDSAHGSFYQWQFERMYSVNGNYTGIKFGKTESLHADFIRIMRELDIQIPYELNTYFSSSEKINTSPHDPYQTYYNDSLADKVYQSEKTIIERFNYTFN